MSHLTQKKEQTTVGEKTPYAKIKKGGKIALCLEGMDVNFDDIHEAREAHRVLGLAIEEYDRGTSRARFAVENPNAARNRERRPARTVIEDMHEKGAFGRQYEPPPQPSLPDGVRPFSIPAKRFDELDDLPIGVTSEDIAEVEEKLKVDHPRSMNITAPDAGTRMAKVGSIMLAMNLDGTELRRRGKLIGHIHDRETQPDGTVVYTATIDDEETWNDLTNGSHAGMSVLRRG